MHTLGCSETARAHRGRCPLVYTVRRRCEFYATNIQGFCAPSMNMENPVQVPVTILNLDRSSRVPAFGRLFATQRTFQPCMPGAGRRNGALTRQVP